MQVVNKGDKVVDALGRPGVVTEVRDGGTVLFVRPADLGYIVDCNMPGVGGAKLITAVAWHLLPDGLYHGKHFFDCLDFETTLVL